MTGEAIAATGPQSNAANGSGQVPPWGSWAWLVVPLVMVGLMAAGAFTGGHWHCY
jgi:hypothetical protein